MLNVAHLFGLLLILSFFALSPQLLVSLIMPLEIWHLFAYLQFLAILCAGLRGSHAFGSIKFGRVRSAAVVLAWICLYWLIGIFLTIEATKLIIRYEVVGIALWILILVHWVILLINSLVFEWNISWCYWLVITHKFRGFWNRLFVLTFVFHLLTLVSLVSSS